MPRPSKWKSKTTAIRVPEHAAEQLLAIARQLDAPTSFVQNPQPLLVTLEDFEKAERYVLPREQLTADESAIIDQAIAAIAPDLEALRPDERWALFAHLVKATLNPLSIERHV